MKALRALAGAAIVCAQLVSTPATAAPVCVTKADFATFLARQLPAARAVVLQAKDAGVLLASLARATNSTPVAADELMVVDLSPEAPALKVVAFRGGCMTMIGTFERRTVTRALNEVSRNGA